MVREVTDSEYMLTRKTAEDYRDKGYEVRLDAPLDLLPGFRADLLVRKGDEVRVVEVKSRDSLAADPRVREVAQLIDSKPGWSFDLLLVGEPEKLDSPAGACSFENAMIVRRVEEAEKSLQAGLSEAAFLLAWSAVEAAIRAIVAAQDESDSRITSSRFVLDQAIFHGAISREEYDALVSMLEYRNAITHGFDVEDFNDHMVVDLLEATRRILADKALDTGNNGL